jgi:hypothetical protein
MIGLNVCVTVCDVTDLHQVGNNLSCVVAVRITDIFNHYWYKMVRILLIIKFKVVVQASRHNSFRKKHNKILKYTQKM